MMLQLAAALLALSAVAAEHANYESLLGHSSFANKSEIEKFIMGLAELSRLQRQIDGEPELASDPTGQSFLDAVGKAEPSRPWLQPYLFEGDLILPEDQMNKIIREARIQALFSKHGRKPPVKRSLEAALSKRWKMPIHYFIEDDVDARAVQRGVDKWSELTCLTFQRHDRQPHVPSMRFTYGRGCYSNGIGMTITGDGTHYVSIGQGCTFKPGVITHEIAHALGLWHEQSRPERDKYVIIHRENIIKTREGDMYSQFKIPKSDVNDFGVRYDYGSVMHYEANAFTKGDDLLTITTKSPSYQSTIGQRAEPSFADVKQMNAAYCSKTCANSPLKCANGGYPDPKKCAVCRCPPGLGGRLCDQVQPSPSKQCGDTDLKAEIDLKKVKIDGKRDCYYRITAPAGRRVFVSFKTIDFYPKLEYNPPSTLCEDSYAEIKYKKDKVISGARICYYHQPKDMTSEGETLLILYKGASDSKLTFKYRFDPATPIDTTDAPVSTSTTRPTTTTEPNCGGHSTTRPPTTTDTDETTTEDSTEETTDEPWVSPTTPASTCEWSKCTAKCGACGFQTRTCHGRTKSRVCGMQACPGKHCCRPYTYDDGFCYDDEDYSDYSEEQEEPESFFAKNTISKDKSTTIAAEGSPGRHIQPPRLPLKIQVPEENIIHASQITHLRASRVSTKRAKIARRVPVVEGSGDAPTNLEVAQEMPLNQEHGSEIEGSGIVVG